MAEKRVPGGVEKMALSEMASSHQEVPMTEFEEYLALHEIDPIRLSIEAKVRYLTIHNAKRGKPINPDNAEKIKGALLRLTGVAYVGSFVLMDDDTPPFKKIPGNYHW